MRTTKPISTISFNTDSYLRLKLEELKNARLISFYCFIEHQPEDDEGGKKVHYHVYIEPSKMIQTDDIKDELKEYDPEKPDKPKGCITFKTSNFDNWYLYSLHDKSYLASKGQARKYHYIHDEIITSDTDDLHCKAKSIDILKLSPYADMENAINNGITFNEYFKRGTIPLPQINYYIKAWELLGSQKTFRNGKENHPNEF